MNTLRRTANPTILVSKMETLHRLLAHILKLRSRRGLEWVCLLPLLVGMFLPCKAAAQALSGNPFAPFFFDAWMRTLDNQSWPSGMNYTPMPGVYDYVNAPKNLNTWTYDFTNSLLVSVQLQDHSSPVGGDSDTTGEKGVNTLSAVLSNVPALDFCLNDIENTNLGRTTVQAALTKIIHDIRNSSNAKIKHAWIGDWQYYPPDDFYLSSGLNVAMPACYQWSKYASDYPGCPNNRAALFYGPLLKLSNVASNMPTGHLLIPYVSGYVNNGGSVTPPPLGDQYALMQHYRLRGADSFSSWENTGSATSNFSLMMNNYTAWTDLDPWFAVHRVTYLTERTWLSSGLQWSGIQSGNQMLVYVSNLGNSDGTADLTGTKADGTWFPGLPDASASVPANTHRYFTYYVSNLLRNGDFASDASRWYLTASTIWSANAGDNGSGCLQLQGGQYCALGTQNLPGEAGAKMLVQVRAKGQGSQGSSPALRIGYYYRDINGNALGNSTALPSTAVTSAFGTYYATFTVPNNSAIAYITPILYNDNYNSNSDANDIVWVDDLKVIFATDNLLNNANLNSDASGWNRTGTTIWSATEGVNGSGCLQLQGDLFAAVSTQTVPTGSGATMTISVDAKGQGTNPALRIGYYYRDIDGNAIGNSTALATTTVTSSYATYSSDFTVPTNPAIASISVILYDANYSQSEANDIVWVDNIKVSFK